MYKKSYNWTYFIIIRLQKLCIDKEGIRNPPQTEKNKRQDYTRNKEKEDRTVRK